MRSQRMLAGRRQQRAVPDRRATERRSRLLEPPAPRRLRHLDALVDDFLASRPKRKAGTRHILEIMLHACHSEGRPFDGWWPSWGCIQVYTVGPRGWDNASALKCVDSFFRYAFEREALEPTELLWLLCGLENARRGAGCPARVVEVPDTAAFDEARYVFAFYEATRIALSAGQATGQSLDAAKRVADTLCLVAVALAERDGVPLRFDEVESEAVLELALARAAENPKPHSVWDVYFRALPDLASALERLTHVCAISPQRAEELAAELRALATRGEVVGEA